MNDNIGGIKKIESASIYDFATFAPATFKDSKTWQSIDLDPEKSNLQDKIEDTVNGFLFTYSGTINMASTSSILDNLLGKQSVLKITDMNDQVSIIGHPNYPVEIFSISQTGTKFTDQNSKTYTFNVAQPMHKVNS